MTDQPVLCITIPQYITEVPVSNKRRKQYYKRGGRKNIPKKYRAKPYVFDKQGFVRDSRNGKLVIANPRTAGKPKFEKLAGNKFSSGYLNPAFRSQLVSAIKDFFRPIIRAQVNHSLPLDLFPLRVEWDVYTSVDNPNFDLSNFWFYYKYFEDTLTEVVNPRTDEKLVAIIPDDSIKFITHSPAPRLFPVKTKEEWKFEFRFYQDKRVEITTHPLWQQNTESLLDS